MNRILLRWRRRSVAWFSGAVPHGSGEPCYMIPSPAVAIPPQRRRPHAGVALVLTIVCLVVIASLGVSLMRALVAEHRQAMLRRNQLQSFWLAESAVQRGVVRLAAAPTYTGEDWQVEVDAGGGRVRALATIRVQTVAGGERARRIVVEARCPADGAASVLQTRELSVTLDQAGGNP
jgi:hypothetical protein